MHALRDVAPHIATLSPADISRQVVRVAQRLDLDSPQSPAKSPPPSTWTVMPWGDCAPSTDATTWTEPNSSSRPLDVPPHR